MGCGSSEEYKPVDSNNTIKEATYNHADPTVYTWEGCEYILVGNGNSSWGSHKGNCKTLYIKNHNRVIGKDEI